MCALPSAVRRLKKEDNYMMERKMGRHAARGAPPGSNVNRQFTKQFASNSLQFARFLAIQTSTEAPEF